jgi:hypothetical protein
MCKRKREEKAKLKQLIIWRHIAIKGSVEKNEII